jgi:hypothetical protein
MSRRQTMSSGGTVIRQKRYSIYCRYLLQIPVILDKQTSHSNQFLLKSMTTVRSSILIVEFLLKIQRIYINSSKNRVPSTTTGSSFSSVQTDPFIPPEKKTPNHISTFSRDTYIHTYKAYIRTKKKTFRAI